MKKYEKDLEPGVSLLYNGSPICWCNKAGKCVEIFKKGYYKVTRVTEKNVYLKVDRKNASHEYVIPRSDIKVIMELELHDLTNVI